MDQIIAATGLSGGIGSALTVSSDQYIWANYSRTQGWNLDSPALIVRAIPKHARAFLNLAHRGLAQISLHDLIKKSRPELPVITVLSDITEWTEAQTPQRLREYRNQKLAIKAYLDLHQRPEDRRVSFGYVSTAKILERYKDQLPDSMITPQQASQLILEQIASAIQ